MCVCARVCVCVRMRVRLMEWGLIQYIWLIGFVISSSSAPTPTKFERWQRISDFHTWLIDCDEEGMDEGANELCEGGTAVYNLGAGAEQSG